MPTPRLEDITPEEDLVRLVEIRNRHRTLKAAAEEAGLTWGKMERLLRAAASRGLDGSVARPVALGQRIKGVSTLYDAGGNKVMEWVKTREEDEAAAHAMRAAIDGLKDEIAPAEPVEPPSRNLADLLSQYTVTDMHFGALAWHEETGGGDYDLSIAEQLLVDWFAAAISSAPQSHTAIFAQLGDFFHYDSFKSLTPEHGHVLDADSRYPKMVRTGVRVCRRIIRLLLTKHAHVHIVICDDNHSPVGAVWLREFFDAYYENEPRVTVDTSPGTYSCFEWGEVSLFYHHGHRRGIKDLDTVMAGKFREVFGRTKFSYAHLGHLHSDELKSTHLMKVERHETLAAPDAYAANGGWLSGRSAKVIHYHRKHGEVGRNTITAAMVMDA